MQELDPKKIPGSIEITLEDGTKVSMRRPKVKDSLNVSSIKEVADQEVTLIANLTMKTKDEIGELFMDDYALLQNALKGFLSPAKKK